MFQMYSNINQLQNISFYFHIPNVFWYLCIEINILSLSRLDSILFTDVVTVDALMTHDALCDPHSAFAYVMQYSGTLDRVKKELIISCSIGVDM